MVKVTPAEDAALQATIVPLLLEDGFVVTPLAPGKWHLQHPRLHTLDTASPERAQGRAVTHWLPTGDFARVWKRIANELQMLLYNHAINDNRELPINSVWLWGTGSLAEFTPHYYLVAERIDWLHRYVSDSDASLPKLTVANHLSSALLAENWEAYKLALKTLDATLGSALEQADAQLTLCGERRWVTLAAPKPSFLSRWFSAAPKPFAQLVPEL
jgi:hypothetical protein